MWVADMEAQSVDVRRCAIGHQPAGLQLSLVDLVHHQLSLQKIPTAVSLHEYSLDAFW
jgi:hypothetical protein